MNSTQSQPQWQLVSTSIYDNGRLYIYQNSVTCELFSIWGEV